jgi:hypothetical protein
VKVKLTTCPAVNGGTVEGLILHPDIAMVETEKLGEFAVVFSPVVEVTTVTFIATPGVGVGTVPVSSAFADENQGI